MTAVAGASTPRWRGVRDALGAVERPWSGTFRSPVSVVLSRAGNTGFPIGIDAARSVKHCSSRVAAALARQDEEELAFASRSVDYLA